MTTSLWVAVGLAVSATIIAVIHLPRQERQGHVAGDAWSHGGGSEHGSLAMMTGDPVVRRTKVHAAVLDDNTKPVILIIDPEADASHAVEELVARYSRDYTIAVDPDGVTACERMRALAETGNAVALILADRAVERSRACSTMPAHCTRTRGGVCC